MTPAEFALKWMGSTASERAAAQEHFIDLCRMLSVGTPNEDPTGVDYAFEKGVEKAGGSLELQTTRMLTVEYLLIKIVRSCESDVMKR
jgi:hypothetical protein